MVHRGGIAQMQTEGKAEFTHCEPESTLPGKLTIPKTRRLALTGPKQRQTANPKLVAAQLDRV